jgi:hypothetical protein
MPASPVGWIGPTRMRVAAAFVAAYALGSSTASLVCLTALVTVPRIRRRLAEAIPAAVSIGSDYQLGPRGKVKPAGDRR